MSQQQQPQQLQLQLEQLQLQQQPQLQPQLQPQQQSQQQQLQQQPQLQPQQQSQQQSQQQPQQQSQQQLQQQIEQFELEYLEIQYRRQQQQQLKLPPQQRQLKTFDVFREEYKQRNWSVLQNECLERDDFKIAANQQRHSRECNQQWMAYFKQFNEENPIPPIPNPLEITKPSWYVKDFVPSLTQIFTIRQMSQQEDDVGDMVESESDDGGKAEDFLKEKPKKRKQLSKLESVDEVKNYLGAKASDKSSDLIPRLSDGLAMLLHKAKWGHLRADQSDKVFNDMAFFFMAIKDNYEKASREYERSKIDDSIENKVDKQTRDAFKNTKGTPVHNRRASRKRYKNRE